MEQKIYYEDYELGSTRTTIGRTITEADIVLHAGQTGDFFPHHMDAEFAKTTEFGKRIAHGTLTFSVAVGSTANVINPVAFSYGYDHLSLYPSCYLSVIRFTQKLQFITKKIIRKILIWELSQNVWKSSIRMMKLF